MELNDFAKRLAQLRISKNVSARDMSLSIGQSAGYINNIENGLNYPSMSMFFYICDYLDVSPKDFFDTHANSPARLSELDEAAKNLSEEQLSHIIAIVKAIQK